MMFPFVRDLFRKRGPVTSNQAWYKPISVDSNSNLVNAYESTIGPPPLDIQGWHGVLVAQSGGPMGAGYMPSFGIPSNPTAGMLQTANYIGGGSLIQTDDSVPEQELF